MFHGLGALGRDCQVRESGAGEIVSVLYGLCSGVGRVALDPLPQTVAEKTVGPASWSRQRFADRILGEGRSHPNGHVRQTAVS